MYWLTKLSIFLVSQLGSPLVAYRARAARAQLVVQPRQAIARMAPAPLRQRRSIDPQRVRNVGAGLVLAFTGQHDPRMQRQCGRQRFCAYELTGQDTSSGVLVATSALVHEAFAPSAEAVDWARRVVEADAAAGGAAVQLDGRMVDAPVVPQARRMMGRQRG